ncbi:cytochrome c oxidase copper chaperone-like [Pseudonaja textilis]|uniref:cytochrome c oxidase copper chaperone-like n=1 Tax=Pseudonaja textilis TaxID=8673 RepID=UPI000EAAC944|nr:cytochrome c oxidase copper chaperone-like [Pseudonaja textilis]
MTGGQGCLQPECSSLPLIRADSSTQTRNCSMSQSPSQPEVPAKGQGTPDAPPEEPPCAELKANFEKCVKEKGEEACKELLETYHSCLRALGIAHPNLKNGP